MKAAENLELGRVLDIAAVDDKIWIPEERKF